MRTLKLELKDTKMETNSWGFTINGRDIGSHIQQLLENGVFVGNISISITQTKEDEILDLEEE